jgi:prepilin-type N-terminal cleavage/methylation domain-containing protein
MRTKQRSRGFTLIEVMTVVVIVGVLALLAVVAYKRWVRTSYMAEAQDMLQNIRGAEEAFRSETSAYLNVSSTLDVGYTYPAKTPGAFKSSWGGACGTCVASTSWAALAVEPKGPVAFGYAVVADNTGAAPGASVSPATNAMATVVDLSGLGGTAHNQPWYVVEALGDINGDGVFTRLLSNSVSSQVIIDREGE